MNIITSLKKTKISDSNTNSKQFLGSLIVKEFAKPEITDERASQLLNIAYQFKIPQLDEMLSQFKLNNQIQDLIWNH